MNNWQHAWETIVLINIFIFKGPPTLNSNQDPGFSPLRNIKTTVGLATNVAYKHSSLTNCLVCQAQADDLEIGHFDN